MNKFKEYFDKFRCDKSLTHGYDNYYYDLINFNVTSLLEIGVHEGRSLASFRNIFPNCDLFGLDITNNRFKQHLLDEARSCIFLEDSTKIAKDHVALQRKYDVIIDDGSHFSRDIIKTFINFKDNFTFCYIMEDVREGFDKIENLILANNLGFKKYTSMCSPAPVRIDHLYQDRSLGSSIIYIKQHIYFITRHVPMQM